MLGETDEWAHGRRYDLYLDAAQRNDRFVKRLWETAQSMPEYANRTALVMATDHGRGDTPRDWTDHGRKVPAAERIWMAVMGPDRAVTRRAIERNRHAVADRRDGRRAAGRGLPQRAAESRGAPRSRRP